MRFNEIIYEAISHNQNYSINNIIEDAKTKGYFVEISNDDYGSWRWGDNFKPIVIVPKKFLKYAVKLPDTERKVVLWDEFFGIFPHETNEANVTLELMTGNREAVLKKWNYKSASAKKIFDAIPLISKKQAKIFIGKTDFGSYENLAGIAHEIIINKDSKSYNKMIMNMDY